MKYKDRCKNEPDFFTVRIYCALMLKLAKLCAKHRVLVGHQKLTPEMQIFVLKLNNITLLNQCTFKLWQMA